MGIHDKRYRIVESADLGFIDDGLSDIRFTSGWLSFDQPDVAYLKHTFTFLGF